MEKLITTMEEIKEYHITSISKELVASLHQKILLTKDELPL